jgi:hypothetical protein
MLCYCLDAYVFSAFFSYMVSAAHGSSVGQFGSCVAIRAMLRMRRCHSTKCPRGAAAV